MKTMIAIFATLTLVSLNTAQANDGLLINSHFSCSAIIDANGQQVGDIDSFEIFEELVPMGEMLPAFSHEWTLLKKNENGETELALDLLGYNDGNEVLGNDGYTVEVLGYRALVKTDQGIAKCVKASYKPVTTCTKDINRFGFPSSCFCQDETVEKYNEVIGRCELSYL